MAKLHVCVPGLWPGAGLQHHQVLQGDGGSEFRAAGKSGEDLFVKLLLFLPHLASSRTVSLKLSPSENQVHGEKQTGQPVLGLAAELVSENRGRLNIQP